MYYVGRNGSQSGPYPLDELRNMAATGRLAPSDLVWTDGMSEWKPASAALPELFSGGPAAPAASAPPPIASGSIHPSYAPAPPVGAVDPMFPTGTPIPTYLWQSIVVTLLCCLPLGIPAIIYASQVESKRLHGDIAGAMASSKNAKMWCWIGFLIGLVQVLVGIAYGVIMAIAAANQHH